MKGMKKILLAQLPPPVEQALMEHLGMLVDIEVSPAQGKPDSDTDLIITGGDSHVPGCPVLALSFSTPHRLGELLRQVGRMVAQPTLYIGDIALGADIFKPQEKLLCRNGAADIPLTDREVDILVYLARQRGAPVSRETLLKNVWRYQEGVDTHTLETHIYRLRQKIEVSAEDPQLLLTAEGGYRLHLPETEV